MEVEIPLLVEGCLTGCGLMREVSRAAALPALSILLATGAAARVTADQGLAARIRAYAEPLQESGYLSGCLLLSKQDVELARLCFGCADAKCEIANDSTTRFCIASLTKPMTVMAVLRLLDQKKLRLDATVDTWIDSFPSGGTISLADLLTHTAGIPHRVTTPEEEEQRLTPADIVARIKEQGLLHPPHSKQLYSSAGYTVVAYIIESVSGMSYGEAMRALVFEPLGMTATVHPDGTTIEHEAVSFVAGPSGPVKAPAKDYGFLAGAGSLYSTPDDLVRFARAYLTRALLSEDSWNQFHALGWAKDEVVRWSGSTNGFGAWVDIYKEDGTVHVFLGNAGTGAANLLHRILPALVAGTEVEPAPGAPARTSLTSAQMQGLEGEYSRGAGPVSLVVEIRDGVLYMGDSVVYPIAVDRFFNPTYFSEAEFERSPEGVATLIRITAPGLDTPLLFERKLR